MTILNDNLEDCDFADPPPPRYTFTKNVQAPFAWRAAPMIKTYGLTHVALAVRDATRAARFYGQVFGAVEVYRQDGFIQMQTPGARDVLVFEEKNTSNAGKSAGIAHFGFRLQDPADIHAAARAVEEAGGKVLSKGEFCPGEPFVFVADPEGYEIEIWYELPTPVDPETPQS
jgi:catechol 2,3-dioxygenase-like lactoylglutathione lyase family enzyme